MKEGVTCYFCRTSYYCKSTTSSTPCYLLKPWTFGRQKPFFGRFFLLRPHCHFFVVRGFTHMRRRLSRVSHKTHPHHEQLPHVFVPPRTPRCTGIPMWSSVGTSYLGKPVIHFRLTVSGCLSPVALTLRLFLFWL